jgi:hypothetical protein
MTSLNVLRVDLECASCAEIMQWDVRGMFMRCPQCEIEVLRGEVWEIATGAAEALKRFVRGVEGEWYKDEPLKKRRWWQLWGAKRSTPEQSQG